MACPYPLQLSSTDLTLTFAQSLDAKLAGAFGSPVALSCRESMVMTHWLRSQHDGILVGVNTVINDNPQLNTRLLDPPNVQNPQPIVLDTHLRFPPSAKLLANHASGVGKQPWIVSVSSPDPLWLDRRLTLEAAGARIILLPDIRNVPALVNHLASLGISSLMVEGGAQIIRSFLESSIVDNLIITVAPTFIGKDGVSYNFLPIGDAKLSYQHTFQLGQDSIIVFKQNRP